MKNLKNSGFTLIELMVTVAIVAILAAVAIPNYQQYVVRSNRVTAQAAIMDIANRQQQLLLANRAYAAETSTTWQNTGYVLPEEVRSKYTYEIAVSGTAPPSFTITFRPIATSSQRDDGPLSLTSEGVKSPSGKW